MSIVDFNNRMREYGDTLQFLQPSSRKGSKRSTDTDQEAITRVTEEDIRTATFDALPSEYRTHIEGQFEVDFRDIGEIDFLDAMLSYETIDTARRAKTNKEKEKQKELSSKKNISKKRGDNVEDPRKTKCPCKNDNYRGRNIPGNRIKKFCQHCEDNGEKYWTHNTDECFVGKSKKEANKMEDLQKEVNEMRNLVKDLKKKISSDSDTD